MAFVVGRWMPAPVKTLAEFIAWCRSNPTQASYGSPGAGSPLHFLGVMLSRAANFKYLHVPFSGNCALHTKSAGQSNCLLHLADRPLRSARPGRDAAGAGNTGAQRSPVVARCADYCRGGISRAPIRRMVRHFGSGADARRNRRRRSAAALRAALQTREVQAGLADQSVDVGGLTPAEFARQVKADFDRWGPIVEAQIRVHAPGLGEGADSCADFHMDERISMNDAFWCLEKATKLVRHSGFT